MSEFDEWWDCRERGPNDSPSSARMAWDHQQAKIDALTECINEMSKDPAPEHPYHEGLRCGVEDRDIQCRYEAAEYGWEQAFEYIGSIAVNYIPAPPKQQEKIDALEAENKKLHSIIIHGAADVLRLRSFEDDDPMDETLRLLAIRMADGRKLAQQQEQEDSKTTEGTP